MKKAIILLMILLYSSLSFAIDVSGSVSGTWTLAQSPVNVIGEIEILTGDQLIIQPGVEVIFTDYYKFNIYGRLLAEGTEENNIIFTAQDPLTGWHSLRFYDTFTNGQDSSSIDYCTIEYGKATGITPDYRGGGIYCVNSSDLLIQHSVISNCSALSAGGGIYLDNSSIVIEGVEISNNDATGGGGGLFMLNSNPILVDVEIFDNNAVYDGGGINCYSSNPTLTRVAIAGNTTEWNGGGISFYNDCTVDLTNITISQNFAAQDGCGIAVLYNSSVYLLNSIVWDNYLYEIFVSYSATLTVDYSDIMGGESGVIVFNGTLYWLEGGNINVDPLFVDPDNYDFNLQGVSPCIDAGHPDPAYNDLDGTRNDMGAYPYLQAGIRGLVEVTAGDGNVEDVVITIYTAGTEDVVATTSPNTEGVYSVSLDAGLYDVEAHLNNYHPYPPYYNNVEVFEHQLTTGIDFQMNQIAQGSIYGIITVQGNGNPGDVLISAGDESTNPTYDPLYCFWWYEIFLNPGYYDVTASLTNYQDSIITDVIVQSNLQTTGVSFLMIPVTYDGFVSGIVTLKGGTGNVEDVEIQVTGSEEIFYPDSTGYYDLNHPAGYHDIKASLEGYTEVTLYDIVIIEDQLTPNVDFTLLNWIPISGTQYAMSRLVRLTLDGQFVCGGKSNQVGAFYSDSLDVEECRGIGEWNNNGYWYVHIVSNEQAGEEIYFKIYETETDSIYTSIGSLEFEDCTYYTTFYNYYLPSPEHEQAFDLVENWNWISFNYAPEDLSVETIFDPLTPDDIFQIKIQDRWQTYEYGFWTGTLPFISNLEGYKVNMFNAVDGFTFSGTAINPELHPIEIIQGYNWIGYLPQYPLYRDDALESIDFVDSMMIKTQDQSATFFGAMGGWIGTLEIMEPGVCYILFWPNEIAEGDILTLTYPGYPCFSGYERNIYVHSEPKTNLAGWELMKGTKTNMIALVNIVNLDETEIDYNKYLAGVFDENNVCRAIGKREEGFWYFTIVGNNNSEELHFKIFNSETNTEYTINEIIHFESNAFIGHPLDPIIIRYNDSSNEIPKTFYLNQNHPNPFNPSTTISYSIPEEGFTKLEIFNIKGQLIQTLVHAYHLSGDYSVTWDASDVGSGIYFYKLTSGESTTTKKCLLIK